tara:strand:- start:1744 stop:2445 length:702 start_codon:yes stop_codon:yes gene_type:complete
MTTSIWLNDPTILLRNDKIRQLWPTEDMSAAEKVNAITRLVIILVTIGFLITLNYKIIWIGIVTLGIVFLLYYIQNRVIDKKKENFSNRLPGVYPLLTDPVMYEMNKNLFQKPTTENPLMNVSLPQIYYEPDRKPAAPAFLPQVEKQINASVKDFVAKPFKDEKIKDKLFADLGDAFVFNRSMLQYNATANTQVPNDQKAFQEYLYGNMISAKEGNPIALERNHAGAYDFTNP